MPAKLSTFCYIHELTERPVYKYVVKEITAIVKISESDSTKISYLWVKAFIPLDISIQHQID